MQGYLLPVQWNKKDVCIWFFILITIRDMSLSPLDVTALHFFQTHCIVFFNPHRPNQCIWFLRKLLSWLCILSNFFTNFRPLNSEVGTGSGSLPPPAHLHSLWNLSHRKWSCTASCQETSYSPFEKCTFSRHLVYFNTPPFFSFLPILCFHFVSSREEGSGRQSALLPVLSQNDWNISKKYELLQEFWRP